jgi:hypothetical protein
MQHPDTEVALHLQPPRNLGLRPSIGISIGVQFDVGDAPQDGHPFEHVRHERPVQKGGLTSPEALGKPGFDLARHGRLGEEDNDGPHEVIVDW